MRLYQFTLPVKSNDGKHSFSSELSRWEDEALILVGGYTDNGSVIGCWINPNSENEPTCKVSKVYSVACDAAARDLLTESAFKLFYDQDAIMRVDLGEANIIARSS